MPSIHKQVAQEMRKGTLHKTTKSTYLCGSQGSPPVLMHWTLRPVNQHQITTLETQTMTQTNHPLSTTVTQASHQIRPVKRFQWRNNPLNHQATVTLTVALQIHLPLPFSFPLSKRGNHSIQIYKQFFLRMKSSHTLSKHTNRNHVRYSQELLLLHLVARCASRWKMKKPQNG